MQEKQAVINRIIHSANAEGGSFHQRYASAKRMLWDAQCEDEFPGDCFSYEEATKQFDNKLGGAR